MLSNSNAVEDCSTTFYPMRRQKINEEAVFVLPDSRATRNRDGSLRASSVPEKEARFEPPLFWEASETRSNYLPASSPLGSSGVRVPVLLNL